MSQVDAGSKVGRIIRLTFGIALLTTGAMAAIGLLSAESDDVVSLAVVGVIFGVPGYALTFRRASRWTPYGGTFLVLGGIGIFIASFSAMSTERAFSSSAVEGTAVLTENTDESCSSSANRPDICYWYANFEYSVDGDVYEGHGNVGAPGSPGDAVQIRYLPEDPTDYRVGGFSTVGPVQISDTWLYWAGIFIGILMVPWGAWAALQKFKYARGELI